ncbi:MAG: hypothetical protein NVSMB55_12950 [Mycobacteriales bacterium]
MTSSGATPERGWLRLVVPRDNTSAPFTAEQLYAAIHAGTGRRHWTQLLLAGTCDDVGIWLRAETERLDPLGAMLRATYPDAELERTAPPLPGPAHAGSAAGARWTLANEAAYPIKTVPAFEQSEPMAMTLGALAEARPGECGALSLMLTLAPPSFPRRSLALRRALATGTDTGPLWQRAVCAPFDLLAHLLDGLLPAPAVPAAAARTLDADLAARLSEIGGKAAQPAFRTTLRTGWLAATPARAAAGHAGLVSALGQFAVVGQNSLSPTATRPDDVWPAIVRAVPARRERLILGIDELAGLVHCPGPELVVPHLRRTQARRRAAAEPLPPGGLHLADSVHRDSADPVGVTVQQLMSHGYLVGPSGTGKTTLLTTLVLALAEAGTGAVVLDPHGDLVRQTLLRLPAEQLDRVLLVDLADPAKLPTLNPLWVAPAGPAELAVARAVRSAAVTAVFADVWGLHRATAPNLMHFLEAALAALIASGQGCLAALPRFLTDGAYRGAVVRSAADVRVTARWAEFAALSPDDRSRTVRAILNKAADFDRNPLLGAVFGDPGPGLRLDEVMDSQRVLLVSLPRGLVPEGTVELVGSLLVSLLYQAALAREARPVHERPPVVAVIDEFQEFALTTFAKVVTATRKYGLGLVVANQNLSRVRSVSPDVLATLLANAGTVVTFRTAPGDAEVLAPLMSPFGADDLGGLAPYECYWRIPATAGPQVVSARTRPLPAPVRTDDQAAALAGPLRIPGRPLATPAPVAGWS